VRTGCGGVGDVAILDVGHSVTVVETHASCRCPADINVLVLERNK